MLHGLMLTGLILAGTAACLNAIIPDDRFTPGVHIVAGVIKLGMATSIFAAAYLLW